MRKIFTVLAILGFSIPAISQENLSEMETAYRAFFKPTEALNQECLFLTPEESQAFSAANASLYRVIEDYSLLRGVMGVDPTTGQEADQLGREISDLGCDQRARGVVEGGFGQALALAKAVVPAYVKTQEEYVFEAFSNVSMAYFLSLRCPVSSDEKQVSLQKKYQDSNQALTVLVGEETVGIFAGQAKASMNEETYGPCTVQSEEFITDVLANTNYLESRLKFLVDINNS